MQPPELPPRPVNAHSKPSSCQLESIKYPEWQPCYAHYPLIRHAPISVNSKQLAMVYPLLYFIDGDSNLHAVDVCTGLELHLSFGTVDHLFPDGSVLFTGACQLQGLDAHGSLAPCPSITADPPTLDYGTKDGTLIIGDKAHHLSMHRTIRSVVCVKLQSIHFWINWSDDVNVVYEYQCTLKRVLKPICWFPGSFDFFLVGSLPDQYVVGRDRLSGSCHLFDSTLSLIKESMRLKSILPSHHGKKEKTRIHVASWNVNGCDPPSSAAFYDTWLGLAHCPDVIIACLQEMCDLRSTDQLLTQHDEKWERAFKLSIPNNMELIDRDSLVGLGLFIFAKRATIKHVQTAHVKTGMRGRHGNKGAIGTRFFIGNHKHQVSVCVINCHLAAGQVNTSDRNADLAMIMRSMRFNELFFKDDDHHRAIKYTNPHEHDHVIVAGDLNYRLDGIDRDAACKLGRDGCVQDLLKHDQFRRQSIYLNHFVESEITFSPTYKYDPGTNVFDTSEKERVPSYCDRIIQMRNDHKDSMIKMVKYDSVPMMTLSDHKPILGHFEIDC